MTDAWKHKTQDMYFVKLDDNKDNVFSKWGAMPDDVTKLLTKRVVIEYMIKDNYKNMIGIPVEVPTISEQKQIKPFKGAGDITDQDTKMDVFLTELGMFLDKVRESGLDKTIGDVATVKAFACWQMSEAKNK